MKALLLVSYDGTAFSGWQRQPNARTVQEEMEEAAYRAFSRCVTLTASGRTDAGVHALGQVVEGEFPEGIPPEKLRECLNIQLPPDVKVLRSCKAPEAFDVTRHAKRKTYCYNAYFAETELPLYARYAARLKKQPDIALMREAAKLLEGEHDFSAFRASGYTSKTSIQKPPSRRARSIRCGSRGTGFYTTWCASSQASCSRSAAASRRGSRAPLKRGSEARSR